MALFDQYGHFTGGIPADCVAQCTAPGDVSAAVEYWCNQLQFEVPRELAIDYLSEFGAWPIAPDECDTGLREMSDDDLARKVLWIAGRHDHRQ